MQKCDIIFKALPRYKRFKSEQEIKSLPRAFEFFHGVAKDSAYRSRGEARETENHCVFHYTVSGSGEVKYRGETFRTEAGQGFFNIINERESGYGYPCDGKDPWEFIVVCFDGGNTREIISELLKSRVVYTLKDRSRFAKMCTQLCKGEATSITFLPALVELIEESTRTYSETVALFNLIAERELAFNPTVSSITSEIRISREHLTRIYTEETGIPPAKYIKTRRFEMLCDLLCTNLRLEEISHRMSFPSVAGMGVFFKKISGITITEYRKNGYLSI